MAIAQPGAEAFPEAFSSSRYQIPFAGMTSCGKCYVDLIRFPKQAVDSLLGEPVLDQSPHR